MRKILSFILTLVACLGLGGLVYSNTVNAATPGVWEPAKGMDARLVEIPNVLRMTALKGKGKNSPAVYENEWRLYANNVFTFEWLSQNDPASIKIYYTTKKGNPAAPFKSEEDLVQLGLITESKKSLSFEVNDGQFKITKVEYLEKEIVGPTTTFNLNYENSLPIEVKTNTGEQVKFPETPVREGYKFLGWFTEAAAGTQVMEGDFTAQEVTLYAHWEALPKAVVTLHLNNGQSNVTLKDGYVGALLNEPKETPLKDGYEFVGWYKDVELTTPWNFETDVIVSEALDLYAKYVEIQTITCAEADKLLNTNAKKVVIIARYVKDANSKFTMSDTTGTVEIYHKSSQQVQEEVEKINTVGATYLIHAETDSKHKNLTNVTKVQLIANPLENVQTKASLRVSYENNQATTVDLRFGGIIPAECYNEAYEYGVLVLANNEAFDITKFNEYKQAGKAVAFTKEEIAAVEGGHQLGLVLTGIPQASYNFGVNGYIYVVKDSMVYLAKAKENASVVSVAGETITVLEAEVATKPELQQIIDILKTIK